MTKMHDQTRVRFAPSPTGFLHVGGLRTALFNYLFAKKNGGQFLLRIEDTDRERLVEGSEADIKANLELFRLKWDEEFKQSERLSKYQEYAQKLISEDQAYYEESKKGRAVRFRVATGGITSFADMVYGQLEFKNEIFHDPIILKSDGYPVYNFANVIDDHDMQISHVIRGEEFLPSTPIHIQIYEALGWEIPKFVHLPLILDKERKKLSKRTGDVAVKEYIEKGYLPEALLNFIALLGWNPKTVQEIFTLDELIKEFAVEKINKAGAIFDIDKLNFINREWRKGLPSPSKEDIEYYGNQFQPPLEVSQAQSSMVAIWSQVRERIGDPTQLDKYSEFKFYDEEPEYEAKLLIWKDTPEARIKENLQETLAFMSTDPLFDSPPHEGERGVEVFEKKFKEFLEKNKIKTGEALWPLRVALTGLQNSPGPFEIIEAFSRLQNGKEIVLVRIKKAIEKLT